MGENKLPGPPEKVPPPINRYQIDRPWICFEPEGFTISILPIILGSPFCPFFFGKGKKNRKLESPSKEKSGRPAEARHLVTLRWRHVLPGTRILKMWGYAVDPPLTVRPKASLRGQSYELFLGCFRGKFQQTPGTYPTYPQVQICSRIPFINRLRVRGRLQVYVWHFLWVLFLEFIFLGHLQLRLSSCGFKQTTKDMRFIDFFPYILWNIRCIDCSMYLNVSVPHSHITSCRWTNYFFQCLRWIIAPTLHPHIMASQPNPP